MKNKEVTAVRKPFLIFHSSPRPPVGGFFIFNFTDLHTPFWRLTTGYSFFILQYQNCCMKKITLLFAFINLALHSFSQNVGIGLTTPAAKLQINSTSTASRPLLLLSDSSGGVSNTIEFTTQGIGNRWSLSSSLQSIGDNSSLRFGFTGGVTPFTLLGNGRVGINKTNPEASLDINSTLGQMAIFNGGDQMYLTLMEQGNYRGYIGSYWGNTQDVDFGAHGANTTGKVHLVTTGSPRLTVTPNGNIGIGTQTPAEKLDVNGSINISQTIKANGVAGQPGQVLSLNSNGNIAWTGLNEFKYHQIFYYEQNAISWTVPAGVTRIMIEGWGGGGGGSAIGSGGGGGYVCGWYTVIAGDIISLQIGNRGGGGINANGGQHGGDTHITVPGDGMVANGGKGTTSSNGSGVIGRGGTYFAGLRGIGKTGEDGQANRIEYQQTNATTLLETTVGGKGGDSGNTLHTGSAGGYRIYNTSTATEIRQALPNSARNPGGGGAGHYTCNDVNCSGAFGIVIIHY